MRKELADEKAKGDHSLKSAGAEAAAKAKIMKVLLAMQPLRVGNHIDACCVVTGPGGDRGRARQCPG